MQFENTLVVGLLTIGVEPNNLIYKESFIVRIHSLAG